MRTLRSAAMALGLLATTWAHGSLCFTLIDARGAIVSHSATSPVDLSNAISDELRRKFPGHHLVFGNDRDCPAFSGGPFTAFDVRDTRPAGVQAGPDMRAPRRARN